MAERVPRSDHGRRLYFLPHYDSKGLYNCILRARQKIVYHQVQATIVQDKFQEAVHAPLDDKKLGPVEIYFPAGLMTVAIGIVG